MAILPIKKVYCNKCKRLVRGKKQSSDDTTLMICPRCNQHLWVYERTTWKYAATLR